MESSVLDTRDRILLRCLKFYIMDYLSLYTADNEQAITITAGYKLTSCWERVSVSAYEVKKGEGVKEMEVWAVKLRLLFPHFGPWIRGRKWMDEWPGC